jgi:steroid delta-isomerase-like uncharacterized protein
MSVAQHKQIARRFIDEVFGGRYESVDELVAEDFQGHSWGPMPLGRDGLKDAMQRVSEGLSDHSMTIEDMIAEGDRVAVRLTSHGRHTGTFMGMPATGKAYTISETHIFRIRDGRVVEHWRDGDMLGLMQQLGALPRPGGSNQREPAATRT